MCSKTTISISDLEGVQGRSIDIENPVTANENDPHAYFLWKVPMTCGDLCFTGAGCGVCEEEPAE